MPTITRTNENTEPKNREVFVQADEDSLVSPVKTVSNEQLKKYAADLAFLEEEVEVMVLPSYNPEDTTKLVTISVNGKTFYFLRGEWRKCPRYVLEVLATAKKQAWTFGYRQAVNGGVTQTGDSAYLLRYPHHYRDTNPKGVAWYDSIKDNIR